VLFLSFCWFSTNATWSHDQAILDAHNALGRVCGLLTETDEAATKLIRDTLEKYSNAEVERRAQCMSNADNLAGRFRANGDIYKEVVGMSRAQAANRETFLWSHSHVMRGKWQKLKQ
jgi:hypothetical protein